VGDSGGTYTNSFLYLQLNSFLVYLDSLRVYFLFKPPPVPVRLPEKRFVFLIRLTKHQPHLFYHANFAASKATNLYIEFLCVYVSLR